MQERHLRNLVIQKYPDWLVQLAEPAQPVMTDNVRNRRLKRLEREAEQKRERQAQQQAAPEDAAAASVDTPSAPAEPPKPSKPEPIARIDEAFLKDKRPTTVTKALLMDLELPPKDYQPGLAPVLIYLHGGGFSGITKEKHDETPAELRRAVIQLRRAGYAIAVLDYFLSNDLSFPEQLKQVKTAVRWLRVNGRTHYCDPDRIGIIGYSAGAHLAALMGVTNHTRDFDTPEVYPDEDSHVQAVCTFGVVTDFTALVQPEQPLSYDYSDPASPPARYLGGPINPERDAVQLADPVDHITGDEPPFLILHGDQDQVTPISQSQRLHDALQQAGVTSEMHILEGLGHGIENLADMPDPDEQDDEQGDNEGETSAQAKQTDADEQAPSQPEATVQPLVERLQAFFDQHLKAWEAEASVGAEAGE